MIFNKVVCRCQRHFPHCSLVNTTVGNFIEFEILFTLSDVNEIGNIYVYDKARKHFAVDM